MEDYDDIIFVLVGPEEKRFSLHKSKLCSKSKFFKAACSKAWIKDRTVRQPHVSVVLFRHYCEWIYTGTIPTSRLTPESENEDKAAEQELFAGLYLLGDSLDDIQLRNLAIQRFCVCSEEGDQLPVTTMFTHIWSSTPPGSLFRKQLIDIMVARILRDRFAETIAEYPPDFVQELAVAAMFKAPLVTWKDTVGDNNKYLESEVAKDNT
jgi:hypothetical protein